MSLSTEPILPINSWSAPRGGFGPCWLMLPERLPGAAPESAWAGDASDTQLAYSHPSLEAEKV